MSTELERLKREVELKLGKPLKTPNDFNELALKIKRTTGRDLSLSTIKRLWGYVHNAHTPRPTTLSVIARFVGYADWNAFMNSEERVEKE